MCRFTLAAAASAAALFAAAPASGAQITFSAPVNHPAGDFTDLVAIADLNHDGHQDVAATNQLSDNVSILLGDGSGAFAAARNFTTGDVPQMPAVGDFNRDSHPDLAIPNITGSVSILFGDGTGNFSAPTNIDGGPEPVFIAVGRYNGDARPDLAVAGIGGVAILLGNGSGGFSAPTLLPVGIYPNSVLTTDFNRDGRADLAVSSRDSEDVTVLLGKGNGTFASPRSFPTGALTFGSAVGDFNGDRRLDFVTTAYFDYASVYLGDGAGDFSRFARFPGGNGPNSLAAADFDSDGTLDLVFSNFNLEDSNGLSSVAVFRGHGDGTFAAPHSFPTNLYANHVGVGDFDEDGRPDLAVANLESDDVSVLLNTTGSAPPPPGLSYSAVVRHDITLARWRLGESSGDTAFETDGFGFNGTYVGRPVLGVPGAIAGDPDTAVSFDGADDRVRIPWSGFLDTHDAFTFETWLKRRRVSTDAGTEGLFLKDYQVYLDADGAVVLRKPLEREIARSNARILDTSPFHHVVVTKRGNSVGIYIDGRDVTRRTANATITPTANPLTIGAGADSFRGVLDEVAIYDHALTASQVADHYNEGITP